MINLIPTPAKKRVVTEYWVRTISLWAFLGGTALLLTSTLFIPINIYVTNQEDYLQTLLASNESEKNNHEQSSALLLKANNQSALLGQTNKAYTALQLLPLLQGVAIDRVELEEITINQTKDPLLTIAGMAMTRQSLVEFRDELEKQENFLTVDLPISNLIEEKDVPFVINVTLATSTASI